MLMQSPVDGPGSVRSGSVSSLLRGVSLAGQLLQRPPVCIHSKHFQAGHIQDLAEGLRGRETRRQIRKYGFRFLQSKTTLNANPELEPLRRTLAK